MLGHARVQTFRLILCFAAGTAALLGTASSAQAGVTLEEVRNYWPSIAELLTEDPLLPEGFDPVAVDTERGVNVVASEQGGAFAIALDPSQSLRDENGALVDQLANLEAAPSWQGDAVAPSSGGPSGLFVLPGASGAEASDAVYIGANLFNAVGIRLDGRQTVAGTVLDGGALYHDVLPGVSQLFALRTDAIKETLLVESPQELRFHYSMSLPPGSRAEQDDERISVSTSSGDEFLSITAPVAYDRHNTPLPVSILLDADRIGFTVLVDVDVPDTAFPVAIDPTFSRISALNEYQGSEMSIGRFDIDFCGALGGQSNDHHPDEASGSFQTCVTSNFTTASPLLVDNSGSNYEVVSNATTGLAIRSNTSPISNGDPNGSVSILTRSDLGIYASVFRGHMGSASGSYGCQLTYGLPPNGSQAAIASYDAPAPRNQRFWAGRPNGGGTTGAWATFPVHYSTEQIATYHEQPGTPHPDTHMRGFHAMADGHPGQFDTDWMPHSVTLSIFENQSIPAPTRSGVACESDGHWTITLFDDERPTVGKPFGLTNEQWYSGDAIDGINAGSSTVRQANVDDTGSGIRKARLVNDGAARPYLDICGATTNTPGSGPNASGPPIDGPFSDVGAAAITPCPLHPTSSYPAGTTILDASVGRHSLRWEAEDFSGRVSQFESSDTLFYRVDRNPPTCTATWSPLQPAINGYVRNALGTFTVSYSDPGFTSGLGSGVNFVQAGAASASVGPGNGAVVLAAAPGTTAGDYTLTATVRDQVGYTGSCSTIVRVDPDPPAIPTPEFVRGASGARVRWIQTADARVGTKEYVWRGYRSGVKVCEDTVPHTAIGNWAESTLCPGSPGEAMEFDVRAIDQLGNSSAFSSRAVGTVDQQPIAAFSPTDSADERWDAPTDRLYERYFNLAMASGASAEDIRVRVSDPDGAADLAELNPVDIAAPTRANPREYAELVLYVDDAEPLLPNADVVIRWQFGAANASSATDVVTLSNWNGSSSASCTPGVGQIQTGEWLLDCSRMQPIDIGNSASGIYDRVVPLTPVESASRPTPDQRYRVRLTVRDRRQEADYSFLRDTNTAAAASVNAAADIARSTNLGDSVVDRIAPNVDLRFPDEGAISYVNEDGLVGADASGTVANPELWANAWDQDPSPTTNPISLRRSGVRNVSYRLERTRRDDGTNIATNRCDDSAWDRLNFTDFPRPSFANRGLTDALDVPAGDAQTDRYECRVQNMEEGSYQVQICADDRVGNEACAQSTLVVDRTDPCSVQVDAVRGATGQRARWRPVTCDVGGNLGGAGANGEDLSGVLAYDYQAVVGGVVVCSGSIPATQAPNVAGWLETGLCLTGGIGTGAAFAPGTAIDWTVTTRDRAGNTSTDTDSETVDQQPQVSISDLDPAEQRWDDIADVLYERYYNIAMADGIIPAEVIRMRISDPDGDADLSDPSIDDVAAPASDDPADARPRPRDFAAATLFVRDAEAATPQAGARLTWQFGTPGTTNNTDIVTIAEWDGTNPDTCAPGDVDVIETAYWSLACDTLQPVDPTGGSAGYDRAIALVPLRPAPGDVRPTPDQRYHVRLTVRDRRQEADWRFLRDTATAAIDAVDAAEDYAFTTNLGDTVVDRILPNVDLRWPNEGQTGYVNAGGFQAVDNDDQEIHRPATDVRGTVQAPTIWANAWDEEPGPITDPMTLRRSGVRHVRYDIQRTRRDDGTVNATTQCVQSRWDRLSFTAFPRTDRNATSILDAPSGDAQTDEYECAYSSTPPNPAEMPEGRYEVGICAEDRVGNEACTDSTLIVDRTAPCATPTLAAVRGATGQRARWRPVTCDVGDNLGGTAPPGTDLSGVRFYHWEARTVSATGPIACSGTIPQTQTPTNGWLETGLCRNGDVDFAPGTRLFWSVQVEDFAGNVSAITTDDETVDERPLIARSPFDPTTGARPGEDRFDTYNRNLRLPWPNPVHDGEALYPAMTFDRDLVVRVADPDGLADLQQPSFIDVAANASDDPTDTRVPFAVDRAQVRMFISDNDGGAVNASAWVTYTFGGTPLVEIRDVATGTTDSCAGTVGFAQTGFWQMDCSRIALTNSPAPLGGFAALDLRLPIAPRDNGPGRIVPERAIDPQNAGQFPTPDQTYDVTMTIRDRHQEADDLWLTNTRPGSTGPLDPPAEQPLDRSIDLADGLLTLDRIVPDGDLTFPDQSPAPTITALPVIPLRVQGNDAQPVATTSPTSQTPTGLQMIEVLVTNEADDIANPVLNWTLANVCDTPIPGPDARWQGTSNQHECWFNWNRPDVTANYWVRGRLTDWNGNVRVTPRRFLRTIGTGGNCNGWNGAMFPHLEFNGSNGPGANTFTHDPANGPTVGFPTATPTLDLLNAGSDAMHQKCNKPDWGADTDFELLGDPNRFSVNSPSNAPILFTQGEFNETFRFNGQTHSIAQTRIQLTENGTIVPATMRLHLQTTGTGATFGLDGQAEAPGRVAFWIWPAGADTTRLDQATYYAESTASPLRCKIKNDCLKTTGSPVIPILPASP